jgi:hypothetical protein
MYIFIVVREMIIKGIVIETTIKIVIKRKVLREIIAIMKTISY